ncbi:hypothetical protein CPB86DRAFT_759564 [Serendipita vermifera]|nr:hypothetical protein CPB86DRAFT_759564 [Serendipita vermifera]
MPPKNRTSRVKHDSTSGNINLDSLPSISRSGGAGGEGDSLKRLDVQEKYREWINGKLLDHEMKNTGSLTEKDKMMREDILRMFRKLREGVIASNRTDDFSIEDACFAVYETSIHLAAAYKFTDQVTTIASQIFPLPKASRSTPGRIKDLQALEKPPRDMTLLIILLHHLVLSIRTSNAVHPLVNALFDQKIMQTLGVARLRWLKQLRMALSLNNYQMIWHITNQDYIQVLLKDILSPGITGRREIAAVTSLVETLRMSVREGAWDALRAAYREESEVWLLQTLSLPPSSAPWLEEKSKIQQALKVTDHNNRWKVFRTKT